MMIKKLTIGFVAWVTAVGGLLIGKSSSSNDLVFGNYSDYISPSVAQELKEKYKLRVDLFDYDHLVKERFEKGIYDIAITSTSVLSELKNSGLAEKIDWTKLLKNSDETQNSIISKNSKALFTQIVQDISAELLDYGIPYFVQKLGFYYRGSEIPELKKEQKVNFKKLVEVISKEPRFKTKEGKAQIGLIDDPRTVLSLARKVGGKGDVNPKNSEFQNSESILENYKELNKAGLNKSKLGEKFLYMTPDSGPLVDALSDGSIKGAFMYNGDGLFAANGGNAELKIRKDDFHYVDLSENIYFLDYLTFSSKTSKEKKEKAYSLAKELLFLKDDSDEKIFREKTKGVETVLASSEQSECKSEDEESELEEEETEYEEMAVRNFDEVQYTPTLKKVYDNLNKYFGYQDNESCKKYVTEKTKHEIIKVENLNTGKLTEDYEKQLTPQQKSDMLIAYNNFKSLI